MVRSFLGLWRRSASWELLGSLSDLCVLVLLLYDCSGKRSLIWLRKRKILRRQKMVQEKRRCVSILLLGLYCQASLTTPVMAPCHGFHPFAGIWRAIIRRHVHLAHWSRRCNRIRSPLPDHVDCFRTTRQRIELCDLRSRQRSRCLGPPE